MSTDFDKKEVPQKLINEFFNANDDKSFRYLTNTFIAICFLLLTSIIYYYNSKDIELKLAWNGASPQNYVAEKLHHENFRKNWEAAGVGKYDFSLPMKVFYYLAKYCGISPTTTIYPYMFIQTLLFLLSVAFLAQTLFQNKFVTFISVIVVSLSNLAGLNLSRFGSGYASLLSWPLFYGYANAFRFFSLGFFLKNKYILCFVFLALSIYCHVNMGLFALAFIGAYVLYKPSLFREKSFISGILVFLVLVVPHIISIISNAAISSGGIPVDHWVKSTKIFCFHWYPITMKLFTKNAHREFFPFLLLCFFFFVALKYHNIKNEKNLKIIIGSSACLIMGVVGIIFSDIYPFVFLIKISLQRSTGLITFFGILYLIYYLFRKMDGGNIFTVFLATYSLLVFVFAKPGIAILPLFLLLYLDIKEGQLGPLKIDYNGIIIVKSIYYMAVTLLILLTLTSIFKNNLEIADSIFVRLWTPLQYFNPFYSFDFLIRGGGFKVCPIFKYLLVYSALFTGLVVVFRSTNNRVLNILLINIFVVMLLSTLWYLERNNYLRWHNRYSKVASSYLDVQLWAQKNTSSDALFMPDPSHSYGWRDFSERSSFGNLREWGYCAISYNPDYKIYQDGIERMNEFGIDIEKITEEDLKDSKAFIYGDKLRKDIRLKFYNMKARQFKALSRKYKINYVVMKKKYHQNEFDAFKVAYENKYYIMYKIL